jgi:predicted kinase
VSVVYCICGKVGSGKSTIAKRIAEREGAIVFDADGLMLPLFGHSLDRRSFDDKLAVCVGYVYGIALQVLAKGLSVVLDFGFWNRYDRAEVVRHFAGFLVRFIYTKIGEKEQLERIVTRNEIASQSRLAGRGAAAASYIFTETMVRELNALFEEPDAAEEEIELDIVGTA